MASVTDFPARARVLAIQDGVVTINPVGTNYELKLALLGASAGLTPGQLVEGTIRTQARKVWTVASGGNFISPVFGPPRTIQGRIRAIEGDTLVLHAAFPLVVTLPADATTRAAALDLVNGNLAVGALANVAAQPGATFEVRSREASAAAEPQLRASTIA